MPAPPLSIIQSLSPRVAVLASDDVADSCAANGCRGLNELLRPWEGGTERVSVLSSTLTPTVHPTFPLRFVSYASVYANPAQASINPDMVVDLVGSCVGKHSPDDEMHYPTTRALLLSSRPLAPHETFNHPVGVLFAISTTTPDPMTTLQRLYGQAVGTGAQAAPWMDGVQVLKFFVVVHDVSKAGADLEGANELLALVKKAYGPHSTLLVINSRTPSDSQPPTAESAPVTSMIPRKPEITDHASIVKAYAAAMSNLTLSPMAAAAESGGQAPRSYAQRLSSEDVDRLIAVVRELVVQSLVPWMEARVREWNEAYQSNRRGLTGRLFGAGRKLFGTSRPSSPSPAAGHAVYNPAKGFYPVNSVEALARRLADFSFMLRDYRYSASIYDNLRRDYTQDRAWRYVSAATEMHGLATLLSNGYFHPGVQPGNPTPQTTLQHSDICASLEQAVTTYLGRTGGVGAVHLDALRVTVLYYEAWKALNEWRGVGALLVRAAGEADEVPCAVIVEEAAAADVKGGKSQRGRRRQAFHLVMAARRYEKAGLKQYSRRCLARAADLMRDAPWAAARERIEYSLGRQAYTLGESAVAVEHFLGLLQRDESSAFGAQGMVLEDMALAYEQLVAHPEQLAAAKDRLRLPTPLFDATKTRVVLPAESSASAVGDAEKWAALDTQALAHWDRKGKKPMSVLPDTRRIVAAVGETLHVELTASNPLNATVVIKDITLAVDGAAVDVETVPETALEPYETRQVAVAITPTAAGTFTIASASCMFHRFLPVTENLAKRGRRLHATKAQRLTPTYAPDSSLTVHAEGGAPRVAAELNVPEVMFEGEVVHATLQLRNAGTTVVENVQLVCSQFGVVDLDTDTPHSDTPASIPNTISANGPLTVYPGSIAAGESVSVPVRITAPAPGALELLALAVYSVPDGPSAATRLSAKVDVKRLLTIYADVSPARTGYLVTLEVTSHAADPVTLGQITPVSEYWEPRGDITSHGVLFPNQVFRAVLPVVAREDVGSLDLTQTGLVANLNRVLKHDDRLAPISPETVSICVPEGYIASRRAHRLRFAAAFFPALATHLVPRVLPLFDPLDLDIDVAWTIRSPTTAPDSSASTLTQQTRRGHASVHGLTPAPRFSLVESLRSEEDTPAKRTMYEETGRLRQVMLDSVLDGVYASEQDPIVVRARVPGAKSGRVTHDFAEGALVLPLSIELQNRSPVLPTRWIVRLPTPNTPTPTPGVNRAPGSDTVYTGSLSQRGVLPPNGTVVVDTGVWVPEPGLVSLGGWEIARETGEGDHNDDDGVAWAPRAAWMGLGTAPGVVVVQA